MLGKSSGDNSYNPPDNLRLSSTNGLPEERHVSHQAINAFLKKRERQNLISESPLIIELKGLCVQFF